LRARPRVFGILDAGASTSPVVVALDDVTEEIVGLYDRTYPVLP
jgi:hypothetical protein